MRPDARRYRDGSARGARLCSLRALLERLQRARPTFLRIRTPPPPRRHLRRAAFVHRRAPPTATHRRPGTPISTASNADAPPAGNRVICLHPTARVAGTSGTTAAAAERPSVTYTAAYRSADAGTCGGRPVRSCVTGAAVARSTCPRAAIRGTAAAPRSPPPSRPAPPLQIDDDDVIPEDALEFNPDAADVNQVFVEPPPNPEWTAATGSFKAIVLKSEEVFPGTGSTSWACQRAAQPEPVPRTGPDQRHRPNGPGFNGIEQRLQRRRIRAPTPISSRRQPRCASSK